MRRNAFSTGLTNLAMPRSDSVAVFSYFINDKLPRNPIKSPCRAWKQQWIQGTLYTLALSTDYDDEGIQFVGPHFCQPRNLKVMWLGQVPQDKVMCMSVSAHDCISITLMGKSSSNLSDHASGYN